MIGNAVTDAENIVIDEGEKYVAVFDPLDGSSNVDAGIPTGTIIGVSPTDDVERVEIFISPANHSLLFVASCPQYTLSRSMNTTSAVRLTMIA